MGGIDWAEPARDDLKEIHDYIARDSFYYAQLTIERIMDATSRLSDFPKSAARLLELPESAYREVYWRKYRVIYREDVENDRVLVVAVVHGDRDFPSVFGERMQADSEPAEDTVHGDEE